MMKAITCWTLNHRMLFKAAGAVMLMAVAASLLLK